MNNEVDGRKPGAIRAVFMGGIGAMLAVRLQAATAAPDATPPLPADASPTIVAAEWKQQKMDIPFATFTSFYTCTGMEDKMRLVLLAFGARPDLKVHAFCDRAQNEPNKSAWVTVEFSSLAPVTDPTAPGAVKAAWKPVRLEPNRPYEMGMGECELMEQMADVVKKGFTLKDVKYHTTCVPKQVSVGDYSVRAESLQPASPLQAATH
jgi:hypothetical protein